MNTLTDAEVLDALNAIERREITLTTDIPPVVVWAGNCVYKASNGWTFEVFNDCGEWDYLDAVTSDDGRVWEFSAFCDAHDHDHDLYEQPLWRYGRDLGSTATDEDGHQSLDRLSDAEIYRLWGIPPYCCQTSDDGWTGTMPADAPVPRWLRGDDR